MAVSARRGQEPSFFTVIVWRDQAEHAPVSLAKGSRVVVMGPASAGQQPIHSETKRVETFSSEFGGEHGFQADLESWQARFTFVRRVIR